jgi:hypothetical protein
MTAEINTNWENIPHTNKNATGKSLGRAVDTLAIRIKAVSIRNDEVSGVFEGADIPKLFSLFNGALRVEAKFLWYERKLLLSWTHLQLLDNWKLVRNYEGEVANNIA